MYFLGLLPLALIAQVLVGMAVGDWRAALRVIGGDRRPPVAPPTTQVDKNPAFTLRQRLNNASRHDRNVSRKFDTAVDQVLRLLKGGGEKPFRGEGVKHAHQSINVAGILNLLDYVKCQTCDYEFPVITQSDYDEVEVLLREGASIKKGTNMSWWRTLSDREAAKKRSKVSSRTENSTNHWVMENQAFDTQKAVADSIQEQLDSELCFEIQPPGDWKSVQPVFGVPQNDKVRKVGCCDTW